MFQNRHELVNFLDENHEHLKWRKANPAQQFLLDLPAIGLRVVLTGLDRDSTSSEPYEISLRRLESGKMVGEPIDRFNTWWLSPSAKKKVLGIWSRLQHGALKPAEGET
jgi:hypothetical protein